MLNVSYMEWGSDYFKPTKWSKSAIIVGLLELWTESKTYKEWDTPKDVNEIRVIFEITDYQEVDWETKEVIWLIGQNYSLIITDRSKLQKLINSVMNVKSIKDIKNFCIWDLLWKKCLVEIDFAWKEKNFPKVETVSWTNPSIKHSAQVKENFYFWMSDIAYYDSSVLSDWHVLPKWDAKRIVDSPEFIEFATKNNIEIPDIQFKKKDEGSEDEKLNKDLEEKTKDKEISVEEMPF